MRPILYLALILGLSFATILFAATRSPSTPPRAAHPVPAPVETVKLLFVGDIMPSRWVGKAMQERGYDFPFEKIRPLLASSDVVFGNLESPVREGRTVGAGEMRFRADPEFVPALARAGFDVVSLANNHIGDEGEVGIASTTRYLSENGIQWVGVGTSSEAYAPTIIEQHGFRIAFIAGNDPSVVHPSYCASPSRRGSACFDEARIAESIRMARTQADFIVFTMHAGTEYATSSSISQKRIARLAIDSGADIVIGHHPHVIQEREHYNGKWIYYSLGNFIFDQEWSRNTKLGLALGVEISRSDASIHRLTHTIVRVDEFAQPRLATPEEAADMYAFLELP
jgi:poly-gamma-glutamate synthesis protein (capsule biosynthesis protein)